MLVKFKEARVVQDEHAGTPQETRFEIGREYDLPTASAQRWINRGAADAVAVAAPAPKAKKVEGEVDAPAASPAPPSDTSADVPPAAEPATSAAPAADTETPRQRRARLAKLAE